jgi:hypothetical protein
VFSVLVGNRCSDFELVSPVYFGHNAIWHIPPDQKIDINVVTRASLGKDISKSELTTALLYKLQRKNHKSNDQYKTDHASTKDTLTSLQLLIFWGLNNEHKFSVRALLIKHSNAIAWDKDMLEKLHSMQSVPLKDDDIVKETWLLDDEIVLMTTSRWREESHTIEIIISEGTKKDDSMGPLWVSSSM